MPNIRQANINDSEVLTDLAVRSEAYWGYDDSFMEKFKEIYKVTEEFIAINPIGDVDSLVIKNRKIPKFIYKVEEK